MTRPFKPVLPRQSQDFKSLLSYTGLVLCSLNYCVPWKKSDTMGRVAVCVKRAIWLLVIYGILYVLIMPIPELGAAFSAKATIATFRTDNVRSAGFLLFTSFNAIPHFGSGFAFRFRCSRTALRQTLLGRSFRAAGSVQQSFREMDSGAMTGLRGLRA